VTRPETKSISKRVKREIEKNFLDVCNGYGSFNQHWHTADVAGLTCWSANPAAQQRRPTSQCVNVVCLGR
jgi:hypothetical protein